MICTRMYGSSRLRWLSNANRSPILQLVDNRACHRTSSSDCR